MLTGLTKDPLQDPELGLNFEDPRGDRYFGNFGWSMKYRGPVNDTLWRRLENTLALAGIAFAIIVPLSLVFGVLSGMKEGSMLDRGLSYTSITLTSIPEFASAVFLSAIFVLLLGWLPGTANMQNFEQWSWASQMVPARRGAGALRLRLRRQDGPGI